MFCFVFTCVRALCGPKTAIQWIGYYVFSKIFGANKVKWENVATVGSWSDVFKCPSNTICTIRALRDRSIFAHNSCETGAGTNIGTESLGISLCLSQSIINTDKHNLMWTYPVLQHARIGQSARILQSTIYFTMSRPVKLAWQWGKFQRGSVVTVSPLRCPKACQVARNFRKLKDGSPCT